MIYSGTITGLVNSLMDSGCPKCQQKDSFKSFLKNQITNSYYLNETWVKLNREGNGHFECSNPNWRYITTEFDEIFRD